MPPVIGEGLRISVRRDFGEFQLLVDLQLPAHGVTVLYGQSGCGKTSLLRCIAGLDIAVVGFMSLHGEVWLNTEQGIWLPPSKRPIGYVFQEAALFPHLSVRDNLRYGMKRTGIGAEDAGWRDIIRLLELERLLERSPSGLSGGEQQRVAIARAILTKPRLLLMDEPLASLDASRKREFLSYLERLHQEFDIPVIYVTHAQEEVLRLADYIVLMDRGGVSASGRLPDRLRDLIAFPGFGDETGTILSGVLKQNHPEEGLSEIVFDGGSLLIPLVAIEPGSTIRCRIFPADVSLALERPSGTSILNVLPAIIRSIAEGSGVHDTLIELAIGPSVIYARITRKSMRDLDLQVGKSVFAMIKATSFDR